MSLFPWYLCWPLWPHLVDKRSGPGLRATLIPRRGRRSQVFNPGPIPLGQSTLCSPDDTIGEAGPKGQPSQARGYRVGNTFGRMFRLTTWGESHGDAIGVVVDGCPPGLPLAAEDIQVDLDRRRPGQSDISTQRKESDRAEILSGVFDGQTLGTPILIGVWNEDARSKDYEHMRTVFRPSHADFSYQAKYGIRNWKGGGRASARETIGRVAAGAIAKKVLARELGTEIVGYVKQVWELEADVDPDTVSAAEVEANVVRCPDPDVAVRMIEKIKEARKAGDSLGGVVEAVARGVPPGSWRAGLRQARCGPDKGYGLDSSLQGGGRSARDSVASR